MCEDYGFNKKNIASQYMNLKQKIKFLIKKKMKCRSPSK